MTIKTQLPLPNEPKSLPVSIDGVENLGYPFSSNAFCNVVFTQADMNYIKNKIKADNLFNSVQHYENFTVRSMQNLIQFYNSFINDTVCPSNLKKFLEAYVSHLYSCIQDINNEKTENYWVKACR